MDAMLTLNYWLPGLLVFAAGMALIIIMAISEPGPSEAGTKDEVPQPPPQS